MTEEYIDGLFDRNASEFKIDKKDGVFIPTDARMDLHDFRKAVKELVKNNEGNFSALCDALISINNSVVKDDH